MNDEYGEDGSPIDANEIDAEIEALEKSVEVEEDINDVEPVQLAGTNASDVETALSKGASDEVQNLLMPDGE